MTRVAIGGLHTECSSYSPLHQVQADFTRRTGQDLLDLVPFDFAAAGLEPLPLFQDRSVPGGPVSPSVFEAQRADFMQALRAVLPLDGVLLLMHGAMFVPGIDDPEGEFIAEVRQIVGPQAILAASFDLHGQVTQRIVDTLDAFAAYRTAPHVDVAETHTRAAQMLASALQGAPRPMVCWTPVPILVSGEMSSTYVAPCNALYTALPEHDTQPHIWDSNLMIGYVWADSPRATAATVVTASNRQAGQEAADSIACNYLAARDCLVFDMPAAPLETALMRIEGTRAILADSGDNPTAGGVGDRADVLAAVLDRAMKGVVFAGIADPTAYAALKAGTVDITLGGALGGGGPQVRVHVTDCRFAQACAIMTTGEITVVVTKCRRPFHEIADFKAFEIDLDSTPLLVVKSGYLSPDLRRLKRQQIMALTDGAVCQDIAQLENLHRPAGTWPFT